jgi:hypothetical protein
VWLAGHDATNESAGVRCQQLQVPLLGRAAKALKWIEGLAT